MRSGRGRTFIYCGDPLGQCPFSQRKSPGRRAAGRGGGRGDLPPPAPLLIATVDKFAQMPWKGETQMLFGQVNGYCPRHGFRSPEIEDCD